MLLGVRGYGKAGGKAAGKAAGKATKSDATVTSASISVDLSRLIGLQMAVALYKDLPDIALRVSLFLGLPLFPFQTLH